MLRIHLLQNLYSLLDLSTMMEIIDRRAFQNFAESIPAIKGQMAISSGCFTRYWGSVACRISYWLGGRFAVGARTDPQERNHRGLHNHCCAILHKEHGEVARLECALDQERKREHQGASNTLRTRARSSASIYLRNIQYRAFVLLANSPSGCAPWFNAYAA